MMIKVFTFSEACLESSFLGKKFEFVYLNRHRNSAGMTYQNIAYTDDDTPAINPANGVMRQTFDGEIYRNDD